MLFKRSLLFVGLIVLGLIFSACSPTSVNVDDNNGKSTSDSKPEVNDPNKIRILYTASLGNFSPKYNKTDDGKEVLVNTNRFSQLSSVLNEKRNEGIKTLTISGGNDFGGAFYDEFYGVATAILLDKMKYDIITPDANEFSNGENMYDASIKDTNYDLLSGQTEYETRSLKRRIKPYIIKEINGTKVGILSSNNMYGEKFGVNLPVSQTNPDYVLDRASSINLKLKLMREEGAEFTILLGDNEKYYELTEMLKKDILNVDFAIFPSKNASYFDKKYKMQGSSTLLGKRKTPLFVYPSYQLQKLNVLQIDIEFVKDAEGKMTFKQSHKLFEVGAETDSDPEIQKMVDEFISQLP